MNFEEVIHNFKSLAETGFDEENGTNRVFGSSMLKKAMVKTEEYMQKAGMETWRDSVDNVHGLYRCGKENADSIVIGSHLDSVSAGGKYDGILGIIAGVECVREIVKAGIPLKKDIHVIATNGEEGNVLGGTFGSRALAGLIDTGDEKLMERALQYGYTVTDIENAKMNMEHVCCYLELHVEQGKTLCSGDENIGVVTGIVGLHRYVVDVYGESNHAGTTMMEYRKDALVSAAKMITLIDEYARQYKNNMVATIAKLDVFPGALAVIPNKVEMVLEYRSLSGELLDKFLCDVRKQCASIAKTEFIPMVRKEPVECDKTIISAMEEICRKRKTAYRLMPSGATHDGNAFARKVPIGMIFVPSENGISHNKAEYTRQEDIMEGIHVLLETILLLDKKEMGEENNEI